MKQIDKKIILIITTICIVFLILVSRIFYLTVIKYNENFDKTIFYEPLYKRVDIVDRNGITVASNIQVKNLYLNKDLIENEKFIATKLSKILGISYDFIYKKITNNTKSKYVLIKKNVFPLEEFKIRQLPIASIVFEDDLLRFYPHNNLFSHILGYVDADKNGVIGIEEYYDDYLKKNNNKALKLTLDVKIQEALRNELIRAHNYYNTNFIVGIIMEVKTGNVLAIVSIPDFNPNKMSDDLNTFNFATYGSYELGSVFKIFTFANGIENKIIDENTKFNVVNDLVYDNHIVKDVKSIKDLKNITIKQAFALSSNISAVQIAKKLGIGKQVTFLESLGLLERLNIDINQKILPLQPRRWKDINLVTISYGYGIAVSPLHIISATNGILNNGVLITPRFTYNFNEQITKNVVSARTSKIMKDLFRETVLKGTGKLAYIDGFDIGGKTGTARKNSKAGYNKGEHIASFMGAFPINDPEYSIFIAADRPKISGESDGTGGTVSANIAKNVILQILPFLDIKPIYE